MIYRAGVIGVGAMGRHHARVYSEMDETELVAVADVDRERAEAMARRYRVRTYTDYREMLAQERLDLVSLATPTQFHLAMALDLIEAGVHLLVEKPIASTVQEGQAIIEAAARRGVKLTVGHIERFNPAVIELRRRLERGELGRLFTIHARRMGPFPARVRDVGVVIDLATHDLDVMSWLIGQPVERVHAETARRIHTAHEDLLSGLLRFADGTIGVLEVNWLTPTKVRELSVTGERGMFLVNYLTQDLYFYENIRADGQWETLGILTGVGEGNMVRLRIERREPLREELVSFVEAIRSDSEPLVSGADGLAAVALAQTLVEAGRTSAFVYPQPAASRQESV
jgi:UDP-N-acetylglucosamine 3-dehydrogenase